MVRLSTLFLVRVLSLSTVLLESWSQQTVNARDEGYLHSPPPLTVVR